MKPPPTIDAEVLNVIEMVEHACEILSRLPLHTVREHLAAAGALDEANAWIAAARELVLAAEAADLANARLDALQRRVIPEPDSEPTRVVDPIPDDWYSGPLKP